MSDLFIAAGAAGVAGGVGSLVTALLGVAAFFITRGRSEGSLQTNLTTLTTTISELKAEVDHLFAAAQRRADDAHNRIDGVVDLHHGLREMIAKDYVTYERMKEFRTEVTSSIDKQSRSLADLSATVHTRLDQLIHAIAKLGPQPTA